MNETTTYTKLKNKAKDNFPEFIVIHHTGGTSNPKDDLADTSHHTAQIIEAGHIKQGWEGLGYHYVIEKDGDIWKGRPEHYHGAHVKEDGWNKKSLGICLVGNFDREEPKPSEAQINALAGLIASIRGRYPVITPDKIVPHRHFLGNPPYKNCYGKKLPDDWARNLIPEENLNKEAIKKEIIRLTNML